MLKQLTLKNFVLVDALDIDFETGLTTITGESGAGKSILLNALGLLLGERARTEVIRPGADKADVSAEFDLAAQPELKARLAADELLDVDDECLVRRVISKQGRSRAFVNGTPVNTAVLRDIGRALVDIHGQGEHQRLALAATQLRLVDDFAGHTDQVATMAAHYRAWQEDVQELERLRQASANAADRRELLTYQLEELSAFGLEDGEFEALQASHKRLSQAQDTLAQIQRGFDALEDLDALRGTARTLEQIDDSHSALESARGSLDAALGLLDDSTRDLRHYADQVIVDPGALAECEARLGEAHELARKHRVQPEQLVAHTDALSQELAGLDAGDATLDELEASALKHHKAFVKKAGSVSKKRTSAAPKFAKEVTKYMRKLGIKGGDFAVVLEPSENETGLERAEFHVTTNPNFPPGPLTQIASGGEQTRIDLSIQIVAAHNSALPCLILDEADVGVGGTTADTVGRILRDLGSHTQVICVTHAPQVAALGNQHYRVTKQGDNTDIRPLDDAHRIDELARMLAGADINEQTREYAQALLKGAH